MRRFPKLGLFASLAVGLVIACAPAAPSPSPAPAKPAESAPPGAQKAQGQSGFKVVASHDQIVEKAKQEGKLRALASFDPEALKLLQQGFSQKYPFIDFYLEEFTGTDNYQRMLLELQSGTQGDWDIGYAPPEYYADFEAYMDKYDILSMAEQRVLDIRPRMVDPKYRNMVTLASQAAGNSVNPKLVPEEKQPQTWDDLLKPEWKGKKMVVDIRPSNIAPLVVEWGLEKTVEYATQLAAQEPIWDRGQTSALTKLAAGDLAMHTFSNYHSALRVQGKASPEDIKVYMIDPVPVRISETLGVLKTAKNPHAALLFLEYVAGVEGQKIVDEIELKASIYGPYEGTLQKHIGNKKTSVAGYEDEQFLQMDGYMAKIVEAFGFPKAELAR